MMLFTYWRRAVMSPLQAGRLAGRVLWRLVSPGAAMPVEKAQ
jgi:hypothetical protein